MDDKWMSMPMDFVSSFSGGLESFPSSTFEVGMEEGEMVNYSEFLNDSDGLNMELAIWPEDLPGTEA